MSSFRLGLAPHHAKRAHAGLLLDKYTAQKDTESGDLPDWKALADHRLDDGAYQMSFRRWREFWEADAPVPRLVLEGKVEGRLAVGLGAESVLENGLRLHHTYGTPIIPASAIKGVLRRHVPEEREGKRYQEFLFGAQDSAGFAGFQDAWWIPGSGGLSRDVLTPHHQAYYQDKGPPTDFDMPIPVHFLTVTGSFLFVMEGPNAAWRDYLESLLKQVLNRYGIGGKRSAGYGRFEF